ncbi:MAG: TonB-dependent receptor, partial [Bacteroidales bacterium]|nr:TonB-dependent receptor [Bacteroidales bacterium]
PFLHQLAAYAEDNFSISLSGKGEYPRIKGQAGVRWSMIQPGMSGQMSSLSPRLNLSFNPFAGLTFRAGYGISEKVPSLLMLYPDVSWLDLMNVNATRGDKYLGVYTTRIFEHSPKDLRPMRSEKVELGIDFSLWKGSSFSIIAFRDDVSGGFSSRNDEWIPVIFDRWAASSVTEEGGVLVYDKAHPTVVDTTIFCNSRMSNTDVHVSRGVEFDFNLGKIRRTGTSLYLSGAWAETEYWSANEVYQEPKGSSDAYRKILFIYPAGSRKNLNRSMTASLRVVQSIPAIAFVVSGTLQATLYDYSKNRIDIQTPVAWQDAEGRHPVTAAQLADPSAVLLHGYSLADNIYPKGAYSDRAESWPSLWTVNLRVTKEVSRSFNLSFYVNNLLFSQPWQSSSISSTKVEKNSNYFSFGFEISLNL